MKRKIITTLSLAAIVCCVYGSALWKIKPEEVLIKFELPDEGTKGRFSGLHATIDFDEKNPETAKISASVDVKSIDTGDKRKDEHLKAPDFFDADKFPTIDFVSTKFSTGEKGFVVTGNLTMKGETKEIEIPFTFETKDSEAVFKGLMNVNSKDFGVTKKNNPVQVILEVPVTKQ